MSEKIPFGFRLKQLRNSKSLSQRELAKYLNIAPSTLAMYELSKREPDYSTLIKIADFFAVSLDYLLGREQIEIVAEKRSTYLNNTTYLNNLPEEALRNIEEFISFIYQKYKK